MPEHPDDLQVIVHDGGPRISRIPTEVIWAAVNGMDGDVFRGRVHNQPHNLKTVQQGMEIKFVMPDVTEHPIMVTDMYLRERPSRLIHPCRDCGLSELFDGPSDLIRVVFPDSGRILDQRQVDRHVALRRVRPHTPADATTFRHSVDHD